MTFQTPPWVKNSGLNHSTRDGHPLLSNHLSWCLSVILILMFYKEHCYWCTKRCKIHLLFLKCSKYHRGRRYKKRYKKLQAHAALLLSLGETTLNTHRTRVRVRKDFF